MARVVTTPTPYELSPSLLTMYLASERMPALCQSSASALLCASKPPSMLCQQPHLNTTALNTAGTKAVLF